MIQKSSSCIGKLCTCLCSPIQHIGSWTCKKIDKCIEGACTSMGKWICLAVLITLFILFFPLILYLITNLRDATLDNIQELLPWYVHEE